MRWRVCTTVASRVSADSPHPVVCAIIRRRLVALTPASSPWSITFTVSSVPIIARVTCSPPEPQPRATGISREPNGTWYPGTQTAASADRRISRLASSSRIPAGGLPAAASATSAPTGDSCGIS
jgi:hypothetical protein